MALAHDRSAVDSATLRLDRNRAIGQATELAQTWTRLQPTTPRAHYHLYKAYLSSGKTAEAQRALSQLRALFPDSVQAFFGLLEARTQFVAKDIRGSAATLRKVMPRVRPHIFSELDFAPEPLLDAMTGIAALGYFGDLQGATSLIRLGRQATQPPLDPSWPDSGRTAARAAPGIGMPTFGQSSPRPISNWATIRRSSQP